SVTLAAGIVILDGDATEMTRVGELQALDEPALGRFQLAEDQAALLGGAPLDPGQGLGAAAAHAVDRGQFALEVGQLAGPLAVFAQRARADLHRLVLVRTIALLEHVDVDPAGAAELALLAPGLLLGHHREPLEVLALEIVIVAVELVRLAAVGGIIQPTVA